VLVFDAIAPAAAIAALLIIGVMPMPPAMNTAGTLASGSMKKWPACALT
jgi:hypothetical protein